MWVILTKEDGKYAVIREKTELSTYLGVSVSTISRHLKGIGRWETDKFVVTVPHYVQIKSNKGGKRTKKGDYDVF